MARLELVRSESICAIAACAACIVAIKLGQTYHESQIEAARNEMNAALTRAARAEAEVVVLQSALHLKELQEQDDGARAEASSAVEFQSLSSSIGSRSKARSRRSICSSPASSSGRDSQEPELEPRDQPPPESSRLHFALDEMPEGVAASTANQQRQRQFQDRLDRASREQEPEWLQEAGRVARSLSGRIETG